jgi:uncharacterized membrane protein
MPLRVHEVHPTLVHFPLALVPISLLLDVLGRALGKPGWMRSAARLMPIAAASGAAAAASGLVARGAVNIPPAAHPTLVTHRNLNLGLVALTTALAVVRSRHDPPGLGYFVAGLAGVAAMNYTAYLGGKLVYRHGVGVEKAGGVLPGRSPEVRWENIRDVLGAASDDGRTAARHAVREAREGQIAPELHGR